MPGAPRIRIFPAPEVLADHTTRSGGRVAFRDASGVEVPLIEDPADPQLTNHGDGRFWPADEHEVVHAIAQIPEQFLGALQVDIYLLPYPRSGMLASSADNRAIYITPGVAPYQAAQIHFLVAHELGHCVHRRFLPDSAPTGWRAWADLRGAADSSIFHAAAPHAFRPHEIFAEDFRVLFGGVLARGDGAVENTAIPRPEEVPGLRGFYVDLAGGSPAPVLSAWRVTPNPVRNPRQGVLEAPADWRAADIHADLFDAGGRRIATPALRRCGGRTWSVDLSGGHGLPNGAYWIRLSSRGVPAVIVPLRLVR